LINLVGSSLDVEYITPAQMAAAEAEAAKGGVSVQELMENAGRAVAEEVMKRYSPNETTKVLVVAGSGNNGGDGLVTARYLSDAGVDTTVLLLVMPERIKTDIARKNFERLRDTLASVRLVSSKTALRRQRREFKGASIIIDAIFGTGIKGGVKEPMAEAIRMINGSQGAKVALDIPSGLDPLTGEAAGEVVRADLTISLHRAKAGLRNRREYTGEVLVVPIGIPEGAGVQQQC
jgi:hydroxyethylthiazole kinase-like uncharacterized protein yjeF